MPEMPTRRHIRTRSAEKIPLKEKGFTNDKLAYLNRVHRGKALVSTANDFINSLPFTSNEIQLELV